MATLLSIDINTKKLKLLSEGDMLLSVNGMSLKAMSHHDAVSLITKQPGRVELELVESSGEIPYHVTAEDRTDLGSDSNISLGTCFKLNSEKTTNKLTTTSLSRLFIYFEICKTNTEFL